MESSNETNNVVVHNKNNNNNNTTSKEYVDPSSIDKHVMISYNKETISEPIVKKINEKLKKHGYKTWIDYEKVDGSSTDEKTYEAIDNAFVVLTVITQGYCNNDRCVRECLYASQQKKNIIPIKVDPSFNPSSATGNVGLVVIGMSFVDFTCRIFEDSFLNLVKKINSTVSDVKVKPLRRSFRGKIRKIYQQHKKRIMLFLSLALAAIIVMVIALSVTLTRANSDVNKAINNVVNISNVPIDEIDLSITPEYRYSLFITQNESIFYHGNKIWFHILNDKIQNTYIEETRDAEGVIVYCCDKIRIRLSSLRMTSIDPQPYWLNAKWNNVWKEDNNSNYFYSINSVDWVQLLNDLIHQVFELRNVLGKTYYLYYVDGSSSNQAYYLRLENKESFMGLANNDTGYNFTHYSYGSWIHYK